MKQRITYVVTNPESFNPEQISVQKGSHGNGDTFTLDGIQAAKEHRITFGLDDLSEALVDIEVLKRWHEVHVRWASDTSHSVTPPFTSRVSPGLHIFFTPSSEVESHDLCEDIHKLFGDRGMQLKCMSSNETAIKLPILSERLSTSPTLQYYSPFSPDEVDKAKITAGIHRLAGPVSSASYIDIDYDAISQAVVFTAVWHSAPNKEGWSESITLSEADTTTEIGVLAHEPNTDPEDIQFGGFLTVLGRDAKPKPTRFQTPTRHYPLLTPDPYNPNSTPKLSPLTHAAFFQYPTGLHPILTISFSAEHLTPPDPTCKLHTYITLPSTLFVDKYQFADPLFLASKNLIALRSLIGATDLEAPDWVIPSWGSTALFELAFPDLSSSPGTTGKQWNVSIPLHLRYLPATPHSHTRIGVPWPVVFWACRAEEGDKMSTNPFDRRHLGYDALFGPGTRFMHVQSTMEGSVGRENRKMLEWIDVPVLDTRKAAWVEMGTIGTVIFAFLGLCWVLFGKVGNQKVRKEKKQQ